MIAKIHSFESFGTVDGPGIRFVIFMQGCQLKCKYCHNRDTWDLNLGKEITTDELLEKINRSKPFIDKSNGGVTVSGGEPLLQVDFLIDLFKKLKELNIHTCIDTSGSTILTDKIKELLKYTDLVLLDIKHIDDDKCKKLTGVSNKNELDFARYLDIVHIPIWIRQVLIPGITDNENDLIRLKDFINSLSNVQKVEILPYHELGKFKWENCGDKYELDGTPIPSQADIDKVKSILEIS